MKKSLKLKLKKITLRDLDEPALDAMAGGATGALTACGTCAPAKTCPIHSCAAPCGTLAPRAPGAPRTTLDGGA